MLENLKCLQCQGPMQECTIESEVTFSPDPRVFKAPVTLLRCPVCGPKHDLVGGVELGAWEEAIARQIVLTEGPNPEMHQFVRKAFGMPKTVFVWLAEHIDKMPR